MKKRFSNILAWCSFVVFGFLALALGVELADADRISGPFIAMDFVKALFGWLVCAGVNYLLVGRFRFLPWLNK